MGTPKILKGKIMTTEIEQTKTEYPKMGDDIMQFFVYHHLPKNLQSASKPFCELAKYLVATLPRCPERTVALRKLLEAKDAAVRSVLWTPTS